MKKIICLLLALVCVFSFFSCKNSADALIEVVNSSKPTKITSITYFTSGNDTLEGRFETVIDGDNSTLTYEYQEYAPVSPSGTERITTKSGKVYYQDGKYSTDGENWFTEAPETSYVEVGFTLNLKNLGAYEVSTDKKTLTAVLTAEEAKLVLGMEVSATEDGVELVVETNGSKLIKTSVKYNTELAEIVIDTSYEYLPITPEQ